MPSIVFSIHIEVFIMTEKLPEPIEKQLIYVKCLIEVRANYRPQINGREYLFHGQKPEPIYNLDDLKVFLKKKQYFEVFRRKGPISSKNWPKFKSILPALYAWADEVKLPEG